MTGVQCNGCCEFKNGCCTRISKSGDVGICWMVAGEGEYEYEQIR